MTVLYLKNPIAAEYMPQLTSRFTVISATNQKEREAVRARMAETDIVLTNGSIGFTAEEIDAMPKLKLLSAYGVGIENLDVAHARSKGIVVSNGAGSNDITVADHAMALMLGALRKVPMFDRGVHAGAWRDGFDFPPILSGKRVGIIGLGRIGEQIAKRVRGFDCQVGYYSRTKREASPYAYFADPLSLATWCDVLVIAAPGGAETKHMVDAKVLSALGSSGYLVNIARGSLVDTDALSQALKDGVIAGAGLDVYESEPHKPENLLGFDQVVLSPHIGGFSHEATKAALGIFLDNCERVLRGEGVTTPV